MGRAFAILMCRKEDFPLRQSGVSESCRSADLFIYKYISIIMTMLIQIQSSKVNGYIKRTVRDDTVTEVRPSNGNNMHSVYCPDAMRNVELQRGEVT